MQMRILAWVAAVALGISSAQAQLVSTGGGEWPVAPPGDNASEQIRASLPRAIESARALGLQVGGPGPKVLDRATLKKVDWPLRIKPKSQLRINSAISNFVDLGAGGALQDWSCGQRTYEGHNGNDYFLAPYGWRTMDAEEVEIRAVAAGTIVDKDDGNFDRVCSPVGNPPANYVTVMQDDGLLAMYWHMKSGSVTAKAVGARVGMGEVLGLVGSSGFSTGPHLHLEFHDPTSGGGTVDAYTGACGATSTLWRHQHRSADPRVIRLTTHSGAPPQPANSCDNPDPLYADTFAEGAAAWFAAHLLDKQPGLPALMEVLRPDGSLYVSWMTTAPGSLQPYTYWWINAVLPSSGGVGWWKFRVTYNGRTHDHVFRVGAAIGRSSVSARLLNEARSLVSGSGGTAVVMVTNTGSRYAIGCWLAADWRLAASFKFERITGAGVVMGSANESFTLPAGAPQRVRLTFVPETGTTALGLDVPIRISCHNASGPASYRGYNILKLSFAPTATPDLIVSAATIGGNGIVELPSTTGAAYVVLSVQNVGAAGTLRVAPYLTTSFPVTATICEINASNVCIAPFATAVTKTFAAGGTTRWRLRLVPSGAVALNELTRRVIVQFAETTGERIVRGQSSVAVRTP